MQQGQQGQQGQAPPPARPSLSDVELTHLQEARGENRRMASDSTLVSRTHSFHASSLVLIVGDQSIYSMFMFLVSSIRVVVAGI
jgi:hypothetical protein